MDAATISAIAEVVDAIPDGPYIVVESPFPALKRIGGGDVNLGSTFGDINLPFGEDFLDVHTKDDNSTHVSDIVDVNTGNGIVADSVDIPKPETPATPETSGGNAAATAESTKPTEATATDRAATTSEAAATTQAATTSETAATTQAAQAATPAEGAEAAQAATPAEGAEAAKPAEAAEAATPAEAAQAATPAEAAEAAQAATPAEDAVAATPAEPAKSPASILFPKLFFA